MTQFNEDAMLREVQLAHYCSHPIRVTGDMVRRETGEVVRRTLKLACRDRRKVVCPACSYLYQGDAWILTALGIRGGQEIDPAVSGHPRLFATLTAPSFGPVHNLQCLRTASRRNVGSDLCQHGHPVRCFVKHVDNDPLLGSPICADCFDYQGAVLWNAHVSRLWDRTMIQLRRAVAAQGHTTSRQLRDVARINYLKVAEFQKRGLVHIHVVLRADGPEHSHTPSPSWLDESVLATCLDNVVRNVYVNTPDDRRITWGQQLTIDDLGSSAKDPVKVARYIAKYSTKTTDGSLELARRFKSRLQIERLASGDHLRQLALTTWDLGGDAQFETLNLRFHAQVLGYSGQLMTKSRGYSTTFTALRSKRAAFTESNNEFLTLGGFTYDGRGYSDPWSSELAETLHTMHQQQRVRRAQRRWKGHVADPEVPVECDIQGSVSSGEPHREMSVSPQSPVIPRDVSTHE